MADMWSWRRIVGETLLALLLAAFAVAGLTGQGALRMAVAAAVSVVASMLRRAFPATVPVLLGAVAGVFGGFAVALIVVSWSAGSRIEAPRRALTVFAATYVLYAGR
ncbi:hypothetical protein ABTY98_17385 [Streptomyces sp. NPDC096040]|uniref:hypothetical protein n=1 Tax=Streptomyces sp. NPDC096040 TaxID=3155541 RepID=UPI00331DE1BF